jgi:hypothetical protein
LNRITNLCEEEAMKRRLFLALLVLGLVLAAAAPVLRLRSS